MSCQHPSLKSPCSGSPLVSDRRWRSVWCSIMTAAFGALCGGKVQGRYEDLVQKGEVRMLKCENTFGKKKVSEYFFFPLPQPNAQLIMQGSATLLCNEYLRLYNYITTGVHTSGCSLLSRLTLSSQSFFILNLCSMQELCKESSELCFG